MPPRLVLDTSVPVLVLKIGRYVIHHGALGLSRSLGRLGVPVYAIVEDRFVPIAMSRFLAGAVAWETRGIDSETFLAGMARIAERLGCPAILVPTDDLAAALIAEHAGDLERWFLFPRLPSGLLRRLTNKKELHSLCRNIGVPCPEAVFPTSEHEVQAFTQRAVFPVVVKVADTQRAPEGVRPVAIARTPEELVTIYRQAQNPETPNLIFQEYIPESCAEDWIVHGYCNPNTDCLVTFTGKKLRSYPPFAGITTLGVSTRNEALRLQAERLLKAIGYSGILDMDYRLDKRDGQYKLLDFNPRIGANFRIFEDCAGLDVARALHLDLTGRTVRPLPAVEGRTLIVESYDLFASLGYMRGGELTVREWWRSLQGRREIAWFDWRDPLPFFVMCVRLLFLTAGRSLQKILAKARISRSSWSRGRNAGGMASPRVYDPALKARPPVAGIGLAPVHSSPDRSRGGPDVPGHGAAVTRSGFGETGQEPEGS